MNKKKISLSIIGIVLISVTCIIGFWGEPDVTHAKFIEGSEKSIKTLSDVTQFIVQTTDSIILQLKMVEGATSPPFQILNYYGEPVFEIYPDGTTIFGLNSVKIDGTTDTIETKALKTETQIDAKEIKIEEKLETKALKVLEKTETKDLKVAEKAEAKNLKIEEKAEARDLKIAEKAETKDLDVSGIATITDLTTTSILTDYLDVSVRATISDLTADSILTDSLTTTGDIHLGGQLHTSLYTEATTLEAIPASSKVGDWTLKLPISDDNSYMIFGWARAIGYIELKPMWTTIILSFTESTIIENNGCERPQPSGYGTILLQQNQDLEVFPGDVLVLQCMGETYREVSLSNEVMVNLQRGSPVTAGAMLPLGDSNVFTVFTLQDTSPNILRVIETKSLGTTILLIFTDTGTIEHRHSSPGPDFSAINLRYDEDFHYSQGDILAFQFYEESSWSGWLEVYRIDN